MAHTSRRSHQRERLVVEPRHVQQCDRSVLVATTKCCRVEPGGTGAGRVGARFRAKRFGVRWRQPPLLKTSSFVLCGNTNDANSMSAACGKHFESGGCATALQSASRKTIPKGGVASGTERSRDRSMVS